MFFVQKNAKENLRKSIDSQKLGSQNNNNLFHRFSKTVQMFNKKINAKKHNYVRSQFFEIFIRIYFVIRIIDNRD